MELEDKDLSFNYRTHCDPRLNYEQSLGGWIGWGLSLTSRCRFPHCRSSESEKTGRSAEGHIDVHVEKAVAVTCIILFSLSPAAPNGHLPQ